MKKKHWKYSNVGIDIESIKESQKNIANVLNKTFNFRDGKKGTIVGDIGHYAGLIDIGENFLLAMHTDGVGTKIIISQIMNNFLTIGIDCVAMNVNDVICLGAEPIAFLDYIALNKFNRSQIDEIMNGLILGAKESSVIIVGGETAIMPNFLNNNNSKPFDLVGTVLGIVKKDKVITGDKIKKGNIIVGINSSGIHSNGLSLARKILLSKYSINDIISSSNQKVGDILLEPTKIYVKPIMELLKNRINITGLAHITGGAFSKLTRLTKENELGFLIDNMPEIPFIFNLIQKEGNVLTSEMYRTFNMGIGFCIITEEKEFKKIQYIISKFNMKADIIGRIISGPGVFINDTRIS